MMRRSQCALAAVGALGAVVAALAACSGESPATLCGAGTRLVGSTCVAAGSEAGLVDAALDVQAQEETGTDAEVDDSGADEPCPKPGPDAKQIDTGRFEDLVRRETIVNCDPLCGPVSLLCGLARCRAAGAPRSSLRGSPPNGVLPTLVNPVKTPRATIRLPRDPWLLGGECDSDLSMPALVTENPGLYLAYTAAKLQPRFSLPVELGIGWEPNSTAAVPLLIDGSAWSYRTITELLPTASGSAFYGPRTEPLFDLVSAHTSFERDRAECVVVNHRDFGTNVPAGTPVQTLEPSARVVFFTYARHIRASNLILDMNKTVACGVSP
ncbi:MAG: hypothetical protein HOO96_15760 [Polyangiaceae bacterium]|nr:hypothetical protein [Polyangiaceae bacterium]